MATKLETRVPEEKVMRHGPSRRWIWWFSGAIFVVAAAVMVAALVLSEAQETTVRQYRPMNPDGGWLEDSGGPVPNIRAVPEFDPRSDPGSRSRLMHEGSGRLEGTGGAVVAAPEFDPRSDPGSRSRAMHEGSGFLEDTGGPAIPSEADRDVGGGRLEY